MTSDRDAAEDKERQHLDDDTRSNEDSAGAEDTDTKPSVEDDVDEASDQSFPASDPPAY